MLDKNKTLFTLSIILNIFFLIVSSFWLIRKINPSFGRSINSSARTQEKPKPRNTYRTSYHALQVTEFEDLPKSKEDIILVGDSLTDQGEWSEYLNNSHIKNRGISGDTTDGILDRMNQIVSGQPKKIFILIGTNDFWNEQKSIDEVLQNYKLILDAFKQKTPNTKVYIQSVLPINNTKFNIKLDNDTLLKYNQKLEQLVKSYPYQYINLYPHFLNKDGQLDEKYTIDGAHLNSKGYFIWKNLIEKYVNE